MKDIILIGLLLIYVLHTGCTNNSQRNDSNKDNESVSQELTEVADNESVYKHSSELFKDLIKHPDNKRYYALENSFLYADIPSELLLYSLAAANKLGVEVATIRVANYISESLSNPNVCKNTKEISSYYLRKWASRTNHKRAKQIINIFDSLSSNERNLIIPTINNKSSEIQRLKVGSLKGSIEDYEKLKERMFNSKMYSFMLYYAYIMADRYNYLPAKEDVLTIINRFYKEYNLGPIDKDTEYFCSFFK